MNLSREQFQAIRMSTPTSTPETASIMSSIVPRPSNLSNDDQVYINELHALDHRYHPDYQDEIQLPTLNVSDLSEEYVDDTTSSTISTNSTNSTDNTTTTAISHSGPEFNLFTMFWTDEQRRVATIFLQLSEEELSQETPEIQAKVKYIRENFLLKAV
jgi:hypothetical protein